MSDKSVKVTMKQRRDTADNWTLNNPILAQGEIGIDTTTRYMKFGDGIHSWNELPYVKLPADVVQKSKLDCSAGEKFTIKVEETFDFAAPPIEVLRLNSSDTGVIVTACSFSNGESSDFNYNDNWVEFDGTMHLKNQFSYITSTPQTFTTAFISQVDIDLSVYGGITSFTAPEYTYIASTLGAALSTSGGWEQYIVDRTVTRATIYVKNDIAYGVTVDGLSLLNTSWSSLTDSEKAELFQLIRGEPSVTQLIEIESFRAYCYSINNRTYNYSFTAKPLTAQLITPKGLLSLANYSTLNSVAITNSLSGNAAIKIAVTTDLQTYYTFDGEEFVPLPDVAINTILTRGIPISTLSSISSAAWTSLGMTKIGFAYVLSITDPSEDCATDELILNLNAEGIWRKAVHGKDYDYEYTNNTTIVFTTLIAGDYKVNYTR